MKSLIPTRTGLLAIALATLASGCVKNNYSSVEASTLCAMPDDCTFSGKCGAGFIGAPMYDVAGGVITGEEMWLAIQMNNQLDNNANKETGAVNTHDAHFEFYSVDYLDSGGLLPPSTGDIPATAGPAQQTIEANSTAVIGINPIPFALVESLAAAPLSPIPDWSTVVGFGNYVQIVANVHIKGRFDDTSTWATEYRIPIRLCMNCIGGSCKDPTTTPFACPNLVQDPHGKVTCE
jgi:hypothetical protein